MTASINPAPAVRGSFVDGDDRSAWPAQVGADAAGVVEAVLEGGPAMLPAELRNQRVSTVESKIKVRYYGGYEHFERDPAVTLDGVPTVFRWTGRTRIAE
ncbi:DUF5988 family protein [Micromonospora sp. WMMC241]|uniref:DUF5988 family protein n=1 Tax=Micromonospora sp. WMMC241 TaxID=3015159 RepID=UPI0022B644FB|nr:DUF5988 family protein [Micromonospora sp. WMMC241]MCZ7437788.1 DUF5988 family protein [Micromonospora sp. WMMC241]